MINLSKNDLVYISTGVEIKTSSKGSYLSKLKSIAKKKTITGFVIRARVKDINLRNVRVEILEDFENSTLKLLKGEFYTLDCLLLKKRLIIFI